MPVSRRTLHLTEEELDAFLSDGRTARVATVSPDGSPHVVPLWFVWLDGGMWVNNLRRSRRSRDLAAGSEVAACVDDGETYAELRGAVLYGRFRSAGDDPRLDRVRDGFAQKYWSGAQVPDLRSHEWLVLEPDRVASWDFRKIPTGRDRRLEATKQADWASEQG